MATVDSARTVATVTSLHYLTVAVCYIVAGLAFACLVVALAPLAALYILAANWDAA